MTDSTTMPKSLSQRLADWVKSPQGTIAIQAMLAPSGMAGIWLTRKLGLNPDQLGWLATTAIQVLPYLIVGGFQIAQSTHRAIIAQVAKILADRQAGTIIINQNATDGAAKAVADPALLNVVAAGSPAAVAAATKGS